jgi:hypothetical protein
MLRFEAIRTFGVRDASGNGLQRPSGGPDTPEMGSESRDSWVSRADAHFLAALTARPPLSWRHGHFAARPRLHSEML